MSPLPASPVSPARRYPPIDSRQGARPEVVVFAGREPGTQEAPGFGPAAPLHVCDAVHVVRLPGHPPHMRRALLVGIGHTVHQHADLPPHEPRETLGRDGGRSACWWTV